MGSIFARGSKLYMKYKTVAGDWKQRPTGYAVGQEKDAAKFLTQLEAQIASAVALGEREEGPLTVRRYHERWSERRRDKGVASAKDDEARVRLHVLPAIVDKTTGRSFGDLVLDEVKPAPRARRGRRARRKGERGRAGAAFGASCVLCRVDDVRARRDPRRAAGVESMRAAQRLFAG